MKIELTVLEQSIIENALNAHWHDAHNKLDDMKDFTSVEKQLLEQRKEIILPLLKRFEQMS
tara:strand:- start:1479 stop:1661 length:183 start_codon:yes stop_codon:yes gene_type:complete